MLEMFAAGFATIFSSPMNIALIVLGISAGVIFGVIPGLTVVAGLSMFLPITFGMDMGIAISVLAGIFIGGSAGGLIPAILLNIPGTPNAIATTFDGHPMALKGQADKALGLGIIGSFIGTMASIVALVFVAPLLASLTIRFGPWEMFAVIVFSLTLISTLVGKSLTKGLISACIGIMIATVGMAPIDGAQRFTFGNLQLLDGFTLVPVLVGIYAISEVITSATGAKAQTANVMDVKIRGFGFKLIDLITQIPNLIRACLVGVGIGVLPGIGGATSNLISYSVIKNASKYPEKFGTGVPDGVIASETASNATAGGSMIPLLTLGVPGDGSTALLLAGFMLHGVTPGPLMFQTHGPALYLIFASMIISSFLMVFIMFGAMRGFIRILKVPPFFLMPIIVVFCIIGAYAVGFRTFDAYALLAFGVFGIFMQKFGIPIPPLILGFVLGEPFERHLRTGLQHSQGDLTQLVNHPIALGFFGFIILFFASSAIMKKIRSRKA